MLEKPKEETIGQVSDKPFKASFFPNSKLPGELLARIEDSLRFQKKIFVHERVLKGRPLTSDNSKSRFIKPVYNRIILNKNQSKLQSRTQRD